MDIVRGINSIGCVDEVLRLVAIISVAVDLVAVIIDRGRASGSSVVTNMRCGKMRHVVGPAIRVAICMALVETESA